MQASNRGALRRTRRKVAAFVVALVALGLTVGGVAPVMAAAGDVTITVRSGGIRTAPANVGSGPVGAVYTATSTTGTPELSASCTVDADSQCVISVPKGRGWKVTQTGAAPGWYMNPRLGKGSMDSVDSTPYIFFTGERPSGGPISKNIVNANITLPQGPSGQTGRAKDPRFAWDNDDANNWFYGPLMSSVENPTAQATCGSNIALVLDQSGSMRDLVKAKPGDATPTITKQRLMQDAANAAIAALAGTPSTLAMYSFSTDTFTGPQQKLAQTATTLENEAALKAFVDGLPTPQGQTNWDAGLDQVATDPAVPTKNKATGKAYDLVLMLTDGNPTADTVYGSGIRSGGRSYFQNVEAGISSANAIKANGTRLVAVGMGLAGSGSPDNLRAISGQTEGTDYFLTGTEQNEADLSETLKKLVSGTCNSQMTIQKQIQDSNGILIANSGLSNGWEFNNTVSAGSTVGATATTAVTGDGKNGFTTTPIEIPFGSTPTVTIKETLQPNFEPVSAQCIVDKKAVPTTFDTATGAASFQGASNVPMSCLFTNKQLPIPAQVVVEKNWVINGAPAVKEGAQPGGYTAKLSLTKQDTPVFGTIYNGYAAGNSVAVDETVVVPVGCTNVAIGDIGSHVLAAGLNSYTITNTVTCAPTLQLKKTVSGAATPNSNWVLTGTGAGSATVTNPAGGDTAPMFAVSAGVEYSLSEAAKAGFANSAEFNAGDWSCSTGTGTVTVTKGAAGTATLAGLEAGQNVVCTINNAHADQGVDVTKTVTGNSQNVDGTWTTTYDVKVINKSAVVSAIYDLSDTLKFGAGITVNSASWAGPGAKAGSWTDPMATPNTVLASGAVIAAGVTDIYTVSVNAAVGQAAWDNKTTVCVPGSGNNGGFLNAATLTVGGDSTTVADCAPPETLTFDKSMSGEPVWDAATGHWTVSYAVTVTNSSAKAQFYDLSDATDYASGITVVSSSAKKNGAVLPGWSLAQQLAKGAAIAAGTPEVPVKDVYLVSVIADISQVTKDSKLVCAGSGTGYFNKATLTTGTIEMIDDACAPPVLPTFVHTKTVDAGSVKQAADGTWGITYTVTVKNTGTVGGVYSLDDTLRFGAGFSVAAASWTGDSRSGVWTTPGTIPTTVLATDRPLAAAGSVSYTVTVSGVSVPKGAIGAAAGTCPIDGKDSGAFNNAAGLTIKGERTEVTACAPPATPTIVKTAISAVPNVNVPKEWKISYKLSVDNGSKTTANFYTLMDEPKFTTGTSILGVTVGGLPAAMVAGKVTVVGTPTEILAGGKHEYTVVFTVNIAAEATTLAKCAVTDGGLNNQAILTVGPDKMTSEACLDPEDVLPAHAKTVTSTTQKADGTWDVVYEVKVAQPAKGEFNPGGASANYDLSDTLKFGAGITVNSASWTGPAGATGTWVEPMKDPKAVMAKKAVIAAGATDTYTVSVNADLTQTAVDSGTMTCNPDNLTPGGFLNEAVLTVAGKDLTSRACSEPALPFVGKKLLSSIRNADGTWNVTFLLEAKNPSRQTAAQFVLTDTAPKLPAGVQAKGDWTAVAIGQGTPVPTTASWAPGTTATVASGSLPPATTFSYQIAIVLSVDVTAPVEQCKGVPGTSILNKGEVTSGKFTSTAQDCGLVEAFDMGIVKTHQPISGNAVESGKGQSINYRLLVTNHGKYDAREVLVKDPMPQGLSINANSLQPTKDWDFTGTTATTLHAKYVGTDGVFAAGMESTITLATTVGDLPRTGAGNTYPDIANTACVSHNKPDDRADNNCSTDLVPVKTPTPDLPNTGMNSGALMGTGGLLAILGCLLLFAGYKRRKEQEELTRN